MAESAGKMPQKVGRKVGDRGLVEFSNFKDICGSRVRVQSSSGITPAVWVFCSNDCSEGYNNNFPPLLNKRDARRVITALRKWLWYEFREVVE